MSANTKSGKWAGNPLQNGYSHYNDNIPADEYANWQYNCLKEMYRLIKNDGAIFYNHIYSSLSIFKTKTPFRINSL